MELLRIYSCFCDQTRLRIINLLTAGPLCVCHFQEVLEEPQVKISKHLNYLKLHGLVVGKRESNWVIYSLPDRPSKELQTQLACLQDCRGEEPILKKDSERLQRLRGKFEKNSPICCASKAVEKQKNRKQHGSHSTAS